jgi:hypothetical protein
MLPGEELAVAMIVMSVTIGEVEEPSFQSPVTEEGVFGSIWMVTWLNVGEASQEWMPVP